MSIDDGAPGETGAGGFLAPRGPRRASYTPPSGNAESLEAAASIFNDDEIAAAMSAELAKIASGPIPVVPAAYRIPASDAPGPAPSVAPALSPVAPPPSPVAPPPSPASPPFAAPPPSAAQPSYAAEPPPDVDVAPPIVSPPAPAEVVPDPVAGHSASASWSSLFQDPAPDDRAQVAAPDPATLEFIAPAWTGDDTLEDGTWVIPDSDHPATAQAPPPPPDPTTPIFTFAPPPGSADSPPVAPNSPAPPPYLGAPAPTVPAANVPPPPGYEATFIAPPPPLVLPPSPVAPPSETLSAIERLQAQLDQQERESGEAVAAEPQAPDVTELPAPDVAEPSSWSSAPSVPPAPLVPSFTPDLPDEPSLEGTAFAQYPVAPPRDAAPEPPIPFPGLSSPPPASPPALVEPPPPSQAYPPLSGPLGSVAAAEAPTEAEPVPVAEPVPDAEPVPAVEPAPAAATSAPEPPANFDNLLVGGGQAPIPPPPADWSAPAPAADPPTEIPTGAPVPFGRGVARDDAVGPSELTPVSVAPASVGLSPDYIIIERDEPEAVPPPESCAAVASTAFLAEKIGLEPTPVELRVGHAVRLFWLWFAPNASIVAVVFGALLFSIGVSLRQAVVGVVAGIAISFIPLGLGTLAGKRSGQPTMAISRATFGLVGNIVPTVVALVSRVFWGAALLWILSAGGASILAGAQLTDGFTTPQLTFILMVIGFILVTVCAYFGYRLIASVHLVISILSGILIIGFIALTWHYVDFSTALNTGDGPWIRVTTTAVTVFSFVGLVWANSSSDLARYQRTASSGALSMLLATFGSALPSFILISYGALLSASNSRFSVGILANPLDQLGRILPVWYPLPLLAATALSMLSGVVLSIYSSGFALQAIGVRIPRRFATLVGSALVLAAGVGLALAISDLTVLFREVAVTIAVPVAAWAGLFATDIMKRSEPIESAAILRRGAGYPDVRWSNLIALVIIAGVGFGLTSATAGWLSWQGYIFTALGVHRGSDLAASDLGVFVALLLGLLFPVVAGIFGGRSPKSVPAPAE